VKVGFLVEVLPRKSQGELERAESARVFIGRIAPEGVGVVLAPDGALLLVGDELRRVHVIRMTAAQLLLRSFVTATQGMFRRTR